MESKIDFNKLNSESFKKTKQTIQKIGGLLTHLKNCQLPHDKNSEEHSLKFFGNGLTTSLLPLNKEYMGETVEIKINFHSHALKICIGNHETEIEFRASTIGTIAQQLKTALHEHPSAILIDEKFLSDETEFFYSKEDAVIIWKILKYLYFVFLEFRSLNLKETSNINFWPHHFDLAMLLFSGQLVSDKDASNWSYSREQMNFGFLFGDESISKPYFYVTLYPFNEGIIENVLSNGAYWYTKDWNGAILRLDPTTFGNKKKIIKFFNEVRNLAPEQFYNQ